MAVVLVLRPHGLLGRAEEIPPTAPAAVTVPLSGGRHAGLWALALLAVLAAAPLVAGDYALILLTEVVILALFAASLHLLIGLGGLVSFGHAAYFGLGAYGAALAGEMHMGAPMEPALLLGAPLPGRASPALVFGWFCVRLSGRLSRHADARLRPDRLGHRPSSRYDRSPAATTASSASGRSAWAVRSKTVYYYLTLVICAAAIAVAAEADDLLALRLWPARRRATTALRAEAIGHRCAPASSGSLSCWSQPSAAGHRRRALRLLQGQRSSRPMLAIPRSVDALLMVLLGGVQTVAGPLSSAPSLMRVSPSS